ncbi:DUF7312 domain-containing protein [Halocalculus aciditolerans]|uniref:DUF7312 domain-containing protein n=1 Tax=Halocalculus aciditolerans TaxID=1383812 RepID=A0A830FB94_9EURY|nr:hypothetical protein [Halocalculus aciditolerans]GGL72655.1 hypothetical protein GCM10009039_33320 [Halocalculus aciditolerans]
MPDTGDEPVTVRRVAGGNDPDETIEPGDVDPEHAVFFALGVLLGVAVIATLLLG